LIDFKFYLKDVVEENIFSNSGVKVNY